MLQIYSLYQYQYSVHCVDEMVERKIPACHSKKEEQNKFRSHHITAGVKNAFFTYLVENILKQCGVFYSNRVFIRHFE
jgi:hypothetical protein